MSPEPSPPERDNYRLDQCNPLTPKLALGLRFKSASSTVPRRHLDKQVNVAIIRPRVRRLV